MKIVGVINDTLKFDNNSNITYTHTQDCCENNWADFSQLEDMAFEVEFDENLIFEEVKGSGFRFGSGYNMFFVPCYSDQNGYYTSEIEIWYNGECKLVFDAESRYD